MKIGVYGGSFNPCHLMHKKLVESLLEQEHFDRIIIIPTGNFYKKSSLLKGEERLHMLEIMFKDNPRIIISDYEFKNNLICTYRTLDYLQNLYKGDTLYFILGADNIKSFDTWKRYEYILNTYNILVVNRVNFNIDEEVKKYSSYRGDFKVINLDLDSTASSTIRSLLENKDENAKKYLDSNVYNYIKRKGLYQKDYQEENDLSNMSDEEFLATYDSDSYEKMSITTDITLFSVSDIKKTSYREVDNKAFSILLVKRTTPPFKGKMCLPGGFLSLDETLLDCAKRVLCVETNLDDIYLEQLYTFSDVDRDIRGRVLSCSYMGLIDKTKIEDKLKHNASFYNISLEKKNDIITLTFTNEQDSFKAKVKEVKDAYGIVSYKEVENNYLAFDNLQVIMASITRLKNKIKYTPLAFQLLQNEFTLKELQLVYEAILGKKLLDPVFRRTIAPLVNKTTHVKLDGGHRPAYLYTYKGDNSND